MTVCILTQLGVSWKAPLRALAWHDPVAHISIWCRDPCHSWLACLCLLFLVPCSVLRAPCVAFEPCMCVRGLISFICAWNLPSENRLRKMLLSVIAGEIWSEDESGWGRLRKWSPQFRGLLEKRDREISYIRTAVNFEEIPASYFKEHQVRTATAIRKEIWNRNRMGTEWLRKQYLQFALTNRKITYSLVTTV